MSHTHKLVQARHKFQKGLLAYLNGESGACPAMHAALAPVLELRDDPDFFVGATELIEFVHSGTFDGHTEYAKRALPVIDKQLRSRILHGAGAADQGRRDALHAALCVAGVLDQCVDIGSGDRDLVHDFGELWNDGGIENMPAAIEKLDTMIESFASVPAVRGLLSVLRKKINDFSISSMSAGIEHFAGGGIDEAWSESLERHQMEVAVAVLLIQDFLDAPSVSRGTLIESYTKALGGSGTDFLLINQACAWRSAWRTISEQSLKMLDEAEAALGAFDTEGAERMFRSVHAVVSSHLLLGEEPASVTKEEVAALRSRIAPRKAVDIEAAREIMREFLSRYSSPMSASDVGDDGDDGDDVPPAPPTPPSPPSPPDGGMSFDFLFDEKSDGLPAARQESSASAGDVAVSAQDAAEVPVAEDAVEPNMEMIGIFIEEAREVLSNINVSLQRCETDNRSDMRQDLLDIRRGVHTLKGSGRMVGQVAMGEVAWAVEHALNKLIEEEREIGAAIIQLVRDFADAFAGWVNELEDSGSSAVEGGDALIDRAKAIESREEPVDTTQEPAIDIGGIQIPFPLFNIAKNEMRSHARKLSEHAGALHEGVNEPASFEFVRSAHTLAGVSRTAGLPMIGALSGALEDWLKPRQAEPFRMDPDKMHLVMKVVDALDMQVHDLSERIMPASHDDLIAMLKEDAALPAGSAGPAPEVVAQQGHAPEQEQAAGPVFLSDDLDMDLLPVFLEEAANIEAEFMEGVRLWKDDHSNAEVPRLLMRLLHTMKGSARMVGAMSIGELAHRLEDELRLWGKLKDEAGREAAILDVEVGFDNILMLIDNLVASKATPVENQKAPAPAVAVQNLMKVSSAVLDALVNGAGEIGAARQRLEAGVSGLERNLLEMDKGISSLKRYLRDIEIHAEGQMQSRVTLQDEQFDPLEFDRFTRLQELTRFLNESIHDVQASQQSLLSGVSDAYSSLSAQQKIQREHQQALMSVRMVPLLSVAERLYRTVRQTAKELDKRVNLEIVGGAQEVDAGILEKMIAPIEHLLRNSIVHGIEPDRAASGKDVTGEIRLEFKYESGEAVFVVSDDGAGIDVGRLVQKAISNGFVQENHRLSPAEMVDLIFLPGVSTAAELTEIAGRGVGMDIVKTAVESIGGRIEVSTRPGGGTRFTCKLPTTVSMMTVMMIRSGDETYAIPSSLIHHILHVEPQDMTKIMNESSVNWKGEKYTLHSISQIIESSAATRDESAPTQFILMGADSSKIALQIDEVFAQKEVSVKSFGSQLSGLDGLIGATILGNGDVVAIINPAGMIDNKQKSTFVTTKIINPVRVRPMVMVVDDSLTVRKITTSFLEAHGYDVTTATDGQDALLKLEDVDPDVMLLDIEMPRMNGFELAETLRGTDRFKNLPIVMITSRTAEKHREHAISLGVNHYMGKPYKESLLLEVLGGYKGNCMATEVVEQQSEETEYA